MQTDQILDLFNISSSAGDAAPPMPSAAADKAGEQDGVDENNALDATGNVREKGKRGFLDELGELWDERQYEEEYDLDAFLASMRG